MDYSIKSTHLSLLFILSFFSFLSQHSYASSDALEEFSAGEDKRLERQKTNTSSEINELESQRKEKALKTSQEQGDEFTTWSKTLEVIHLPEEDNVDLLDTKDGSLRSTFNSYFKESLDKLISSLKKGEKPRQWDKPEYVTPEEAREFFSGYVIETLKCLEEEEQQKIITSLFTSDYFGCTLSLKEETPEEIAKADPYLIDHIAGMLASGRPGHEGTMEEASKRWKLKTRFLTPEEAARGFTSHQFWGKRYKFEDIIQRTDIFSSQYFGIPEDPILREEYFLSNSIGFLTPDLIKNTYEAAKKALTLSEPGSYFVIFGNTPYFYGRTLKQLIAKDPLNPLDRKIIELPFSGSPNRVRQNNFPTAKNVVTPARLNHLRQRMKALGLSPENEELGKYPIYFVDVYASASGLAYVVEDLLKQFRATDKPFPEIRAISLNRINIHNKDDQRNASIAKENADEKGCVRFFLPSVYEPHFALDCFETYVEGHTQYDMLPSNDWRVFPQYEAYRWVSDYDGLLRQSASKHMKILFEYFDTHIKNLMDMEATTSN